MQTSIYMNESMINNLYPRNVYCQMGLPTMTNGKSGLSLMNNNYNRTEFEICNPAKMSSFNQPDRVTMKIDVSYTDHSHVIGKGGQSIKAIMTETQCHIHFPDSNRTNTIEKSNQVSISGLPSGVELARQKIRAILPLIYSFDIPYAPYNVLEQQDRSLIAQLQRLLEVSISYRPMGKVVSGTTVYVKGIVLRSKQTIKAVNIILGHHFGQNIEQIPVMMTIEIDPKHHSFLLNQGGQNSLGNEIYVLTGATINFPDNTFTSAHAAMAANNPMGISGLFKKSTVTIWGTSENTFEARQQIIGRLPVILMYDITIEEGVNLEMLNLNSINEKYDVHISIKLKLKQSTKSVIIRTTEQNVQALFEVKKILNKLRSQYKPIIQAGIKTFPQIQLAKINNMMDIKISQNGIIINDAADSMKMEKLTPMAHNTNTSNGIMPNMIPARAAVCFSNASSNSSFLNELVPLTINGSSNLHAFSSKVSTMEASLTNSSVGYRAESQRCLVKPQLINGTLETHSMSPLDCGSGSGTESSTSTGNSPPLANSATDWRAPGAEYSAKQRELKRSMTGSPLLHLSDLARQCADISLYESLEKEDPNEAKQNSNGRHQEDDRLTRFEDYCTNGNSNAALKEIEECRNYGNNRDVIKILQNLDLGRYIENFMDNEVDFGTFCSLTEEDLKELGVQTLGARRKLMLTINDIHSTTNQ